MWQDPHSGRRGHSLMTKELGNKVAGLGQTQNLSADELDDYVPLVKLFTPTSGWTWYIMEWDEKSGECFGLAQGFEQEFGYFSLPELADVRVMGIMPAVERDIYWKPEAIGEIRQRWSEAAVYG